MIRVCVYTLILALTYIIFKRFRNTHDQKDFVRLSRCLLCIYLVLGFYYTVGSRLWMQPIDILKNAIRFVGRYDDKPYGEFSAIENVINRAYLFVKDERSIWYTLPSILLNILLYVPLGLLLLTSFNMKKVSIVILIGILISIITELIQGLFFLGTPDALDVLCNTIGVYIGVIAYRFLNSGSSNNNDK